MKYFKLLLILFFLFEANNSFAQSDLAEQYYQQAENLRLGKGKSYRLRDEVNADLDQAFELYDKAIQLGNTQAMVIVAKYAMNFVGVKKCWDKRLKKLQCVNKYNIGKYDFPTVLAMKLLKDAADNGNTYAMFLLGTWSPKMARHIGSDKGSASGRNYYYFIGWNNYENGVSDDMSQYYLNKAISLGYKPAILANDWLCNGEKVIDSDLFMEMEKVAEDNDDIAWVICLLLLNVSDSQTQDKQNELRGRALYWYQKIKDGTFAYLIPKIATVVPIPTLGPDGQLHPVYTYRTVEEDLLSLNLTPIAPQYKDDINNKVKVELPVIANVDTQIPTIAQKNPNTYVLLIANEKYDDVKDVEYALSDGQIFKEYCVKTLGVPEQNINIRENATLNKMISGVDWLTDICAATNGKANVIVYYSGHGFPNEATQDAYLLPSDGSGKNTRTGFSLNEFYTTLSQVNAKSVTIFLDACFSGATRGNDMLVAARGVAIKAKAEAPKGNMVVFSAAQGDETAYPFEQAKHGMFTYYLLNKLKESNGDVTLGELSDYIQQEVSKESVLINGKPQTPQVSVSPSMQSTWRNMKLK